MKRNLFLLLLLGVFSLTAGTAAYFTHSATARNVITAGAVSIALEEKHQSTGGAVVEFPPEGITGLMPGCSASKLVRVRNTGAESWIRVKCHISATAADGTALPTDVVALDISPQWLYQEGWYYCQEAIPQDGLTPLLFSQVDFSPAMGNEYQNARVVITLQAQAVQTAHNGSAVTEAIGWPENKEVAG